MSIEQADTRRLTVTRTVTVHASQERAFEVFTERFGTWWPRSHHIGDAELADAIIEPEVGGRFYERCVDGSECDWGQVLAYDPPRRLVLSWNLQADWSYAADPARASEVEVRFVVQDPDTTRVELEHRHIERHGDGAAEIHSSVGSDNGWAGILAHYAEQTG